MAHNVHKHESGEWSMAFTGDRKAVWWGGGQQLAPDVTLADAIRAGHLDYEVELRVCAGQGPDGVWREIPGYHTTWRKDTNQPISAVGDEYRVCQNREVFAILEGIPNLAFDTCGVLGRGEMAWMLVRDLDDRIKIRGEEIDARILFYNSFDRSTKIGGGYTRVRVVCQNTLNMALGAGLKNGFTLRHSAEIANHREEIESIIENSRHYSEAMREYGERMALHLLTPARATALFTHLVPDPIESKIAPEKLAAAKTRDTLEGLYRHGAGNRGESLWDWTNAAIEWVDFHKVCRPRSKPVDEARFESAVFGSALRFKQTAFDIAKAELEGDYEVEALVAVPAYN
jgi:phage/plasmid-like protein (TIGR03299 family)